MEITVNMPNRPKGESVEIPGLGLFVNGETHDVDDEQVVLALKAGFPLDDLVEVSAKRSVVFGDQGAELPPSVDEYETTPVDNADMAGGGE